MTTGILRLRVAFFLITLLIPLVCRVSNSNSATLVVTSASDSGPGSLRQAIADAAPGDVIEFKLTYPATISLTSGELLLNKNLTIAGPGARDLAISGNSSSRVFNNTSTANVSLERMTIINGKALSGGGLATAPQSMFRLINLALTGNAATFGGAIANAGTMELLRVTVNNNSTGSGGSGGGIYNDTSGILEISSSTITGNSAMQGGAIYNYNIMRSSNATVTANNTTSTTSASIENVPVTGYELTLYNNIISGNGGNDLLGTPTHAHNNLIQFPPASLGTDSIANITGVSPLLGPLANNGGPTDTFALLAGSPALNAAELIHCSFLDQRGVTRIRSGGCDIGSYEASMPLSLSATGDSVSTLSGLAGSLGAVNGPALLARFNEPIGLTTDGTYLYVADRSNNLIRSILISTGAVTTLAGSGTAAYADGIGAAAAFNQPNSLLLVSQPTGLQLFVADTGNNRIRQVDVATGTVTTLAGNGTLASIDGEGLGASFDQPVALTWALGGLIVTDNGSNRIRRIYHGIVTTVAGSSAGYLDGVGSAAQFNKPYGLAADLDNLYVADNGNSVIRKVDLYSGAVTTLAGDGFPGETDAVGTLAQFFMPVGLVLDEGQLYVSDYGGHTIRRVDLSSTQVTTIAGSPLFAGAADGVGSSALFNYPAGLASDGIRLFIADSTNHTIRSMSDTIPPADGVLTAVPAGSSRIDLTWTAATDTGSGLPKTNIYKLVRSAGAAAPADCSGNPIYQGNGTTYSDMGLVSSSQYSYRVCATDVAGNISPGAVATATTPSAISISPASYAFADQQVGTSSSPVLFTISNSSVIMPVNITPSITGVNAADFILNASGCGSVPPYFIMYGASCTITVAFAPSAGSAPLRNASLSVQTNESGSPVINSILSGGATIAISASTGSGGGISPSGTFVVPAGSNQVYTLTPNTGYHVTDVLVDGVSVGAVTGYTFSSVTTNHTISASYAIDQFTVSFNSNGGSAVASQTVPYGGNVTVPTLPTRTGYTFAGWYSDSALTVAFAFTTPITANTTLYADWTINSYTLTYTTGTNGTLNGTATQSVNYNASGTPVTAVPDIGYHFVQWSDGLTSATRTDSSVTASQSVTASFAINSYTLIFSAGPNGSISGTTQQIINHGSSSSAMTAVPATGYNFVNWTGTGGFVATTANPLTVSNVTADMAITANFAASTYNITATAGVNGTISQPGITTVSYGASQSYTITPATGYHVLDLLVDGVSAGVVTSFTFNAVSANHTIDVSFAINTYSVTATAGANGTISPPGTTTVNFSTNQGYTITPAIGYHVADVLVDGVSIGAVTGYTFSNVTANHSISASFVINSYSIAAATGVNGTVAPVGTTTLNYGSGQTYTITPATGYHVVDVLVDGVSMGSVSSYTFSNVAAGHSISANFAINTYAITATAGANGTVSPAGATMVNHGAGQAYTITPVSGYHIVDVKVDGTSVGAVSSYTFSNVTAGHTIAAAFALPDGILIPRTGKVEPELVDAIKALRISAGIEQATQEELSRGDVAPLVNGVPQPDKKITLGDAVVILRRVVGLVTW